MDGTDNSDQLRTLTLSMNQVDDKVPLSQIAQSTTCVALETRDTVLIGNIAKVMHQNNRLYVADREAIYTFDEAGAFISKLHAIGKGPDEYTAVSDFVPDAAGNLWVLSRGNQTLLQYAPDNRLLNRIALNYHAIAISLITPQTMLLYMGNELNEENKHQVRLLNLTTQKATETALPINVEKSKYLHVNGQNITAGGAEGTNRYLFQPFNDTIYRVTPSAEVSPAFYLDINKQNIPATFYDHPYENIMDFFQTLHKHTYAYGTQLFAETPTGYLFSFYQGGKCHFALLPKSEEGNERVFLQLEADGSLCGYPINLTDLSLFIQPNNELIIPLTPSDIMEYAESTADAAALPTLKAQLRGGAEDSNPLLLLVGLK